MGFSTQELLERLRRLEAENGNVPSSGDVRRNDEAPAVTTYYSRFGGSWRNVEVVYEQWKVVGEDWNAMEYENWRESMDVDGLPTEIPAEPSQTSIVRELRDQY